MDAVKDGLEPQSSYDTSGKVWHTWHNPGKPFWLQYEFPSPTLVKAVQVYWFDESVAKASCRVPAAWRLLAKRNGQWAEVEKPTGYGVAPDKYNQTGFTPVEVEGLRIEAQSKVGWSSGVLEWKVE